jgi:hypothetical protein
MEIKCLPSGDPAPQLPTPRPTPQPTLSLSPGPTSKPTSKHFKRLAPRNRPQDDPFVRANAESSPFSALPDDVDVFDTPLAKKCYNQRRLRGSRHRKEAQPDDDELVSLLSNWDAFLTPERPKRNAGHIEPCAGSLDPKITVRGSLFSSVQRPPKHHLQTSPKSKSPQRSITETSSLRKRPRRATAELTRKRLRSADEDEFEVGSDGLLPLPKTKRARLYSTPNNTDRKNPDASKAHPDTPASSTNGSPNQTTQRRTFGLSPLPKKKDNQVPHATNTGLGTPDESATDSPSPTTSRRGFKAFLSPKNTEDQGPYAGDSLPGTPASFANSPSPAAAPRSAAREQSLNPTASIQTKRKRGAQEAGLSSSREELKRMKFTKPPAHIENPPETLNPSRYLSVR